MSIMKAMFPVVKKAAKLTKHIKQHPVQNVLANQMIYGQKSLKAGVTVPIVIGQSPSKNARKEVSKLISGTSKKVWLINSPIFQESLPQSLLPLP